MGMGMKSLKWEGFVTKNPFPHISTRDPEYITPLIKSLLCKRNKLMRAVRVEKAGAIARRVGKRL